MAACQVKMRDLSTELPTLIRSLRKSRGLTQVDLAEELGVTPTTIHRYESGTSAPAWNILHALFNLASQTADTTKEQEAIRKMLEKQPGADRLKRLDRQSGRVAGGSLLDVEVLASLSEVEREHLEATLRLLRRADENTTRILGALLEPWLSKPDPIPNLDE